MAKADVRFYLDLGGALKHKFLNPQAVDYQLSSGYARYDPTIFNWVKSTFETIKTRSGIDYSDYLNIEERPVLEKLVKQLGSDSRLSFLNDPNLNADKFELPEQLHEQIILEQKAEQQVYERSAKAPAGGAPILQTRAPEKISPEEEEEPEDLEKETEEQPSKEAETPKETETPKEQTPSPEKENRMPQMPSLPQTPRANIRMPSEKPPTEEVGKTAKTPRRGFSVPRPSKGVTSWAKNTGANAGSLAQRNASKALNGLGNSILKNGGKGINTAINMGQDLSNRISRSPLFSMPKKAVLLWLLFLMVILFVLTGAGPLPTTPPGPGSGDISMCTFTRSDQSPSGAKYQSPLLISYINEASTKSSVPPQVLASFMRVESPGATGFSDDQVKSYFDSCMAATGAPYISPTGAIGIMQLEPIWGTAGYCGPCTEAGAKLVGKTAADLTKADYCNLEEEITVGAGWILGKMALLGYGDGTKWDPSWTTDPTAINTMVKGYYGCLLYPSCTSGPYSYGDDVLQSVQACIITSPIAGSSEIVNQTLRISNALEPGSCDGDYDRMVANITNGTYTAVTRTGDVCRGTGPDGWYWCTDLIIDAFNLAGKTGLSISEGDEAVITMKNKWESHPGYTLIPYDSTNGQPSLSSINGKAGFAMFRLGSPSDHVSIVQEVVIDATTGSGHITTLDSNTPRKTFTLSVVGWKIIEISGFSPIWGFGAVQ